MIQTFAISATSIAWAIFLLAGFASVCAYRDSQHYDPFAISAIGSVVSGAVAIVAGLIAAIGSAVLWFRK